MAGSPVPRQGRSVPGYAPDAHGSHLERIGTEWVRRQWPFPPVVADRPVVHASCTRDRDPRVDGDMDGEGNPPLHIAGRVWPWQDRRTSSPVIIVKAIREANLDARRRPTLVACCGTHVVQDGLTASIYVLLPVLAQTFGLGYAQVGMIRAAHGAAAWVFELPSGILSERFGQRKPAGVRAALRRSRVPRRVDGRRAQWGADRTRHRRLWQRLPALALLIAGERTVRRARRDVPRSAFSMPAATPASSCSPDRPPPSSAPAPAGRA